VRACDLEGWRWRVCRGGASALREWLDTEGVAKHEKHNESLACALHGPKNTSQMDNLPTDCLDPQTRSFVQPDPAIDTRLRFDEFVPGRVNRASSVLRDPEVKPRMSLWH